MRPSSAGAPDSSGVTVALFVLAAVVIPGALAYSLATSSELRVLAVVIGLLGLMVVFARPFWGLIFFVGLLYARPEETIPGLQGMRLTLVISIVTLVGLFFQLFLNRERLVRTPLNGMIIGFGLMAVASTFGHGTTAAAAQDVSKLVILVLLVLNLIRTRRQYQALVTALLVFTTYLALFSIYQYATGNAMQQGDLERSKATGIFGDPNDLAATLVVGIALLVTRMLGARLPARFGYGGLLALCVFAVLLTNSRGGLLSLLAVAGGSVVLIRGKNRLPALVIAGLLGMLLLVVAPSRMTSFDSKEESANLRFWFWDNGITMLLQNPVSGVGYGRFPQVNMGGYTAHNSFVLCFGELGLPGYFFWMGALYYCYRRRTAADAEPTAEDRQSLLGARLALAGFLVAGFFLSRTYIPVTYLLIGLPVAAQVAANGRPDALKLTPRERWLDWGRIALACLGSIVLIKIMADMYR